MIIHVVLPGQTVYSIAREYGVSISDIVAYNGLRWPYQLAVGQTLVILFPEQVYIVRENQTLTAIANETGLSLRQLYRNNPALEGNSFIVPGQRLVLSFQETKKGAVEVISYAYPFVDIGILRQALPFMTYLSPFTYGIAHEGDLVPVDDEEIMSLCREYGVAPMMHLSTLTETGHFSSERGREVVASPAIQQRLIPAVEQNIFEKGYYGLDVDFEALPGDYAQSYADFIRLLRDTLAPRPVFVALAAKTYAKEPGIWTVGHDYRALGEAADAVLLMTYEWGYTYSPPMAVAPLGSVEKVLQYALTEISPDKILLGIPNYGYDWTLPYIWDEPVAAVSISNERAVELAVRYRAEIHFDETAMSPWFQYIDEEERIHEVWFEDGRSIEAKLNLIARYHLLGAGYWHVGRSFIQNWSILNAMFDIIERPLA